MKNNEIEDTQKTAASNVTQIKSIGAESNQFQETVVVTGSSGFIGAALVKELAKNYRVVAFDRETSPHPPVVAECICIDLTDNDSITAAMQRLCTAYGNKIASVIHLAAYFDLSGCLVSKNLILNSLCLSVRCSCISRANTANR